MKKNIIGLLLGLVATVALAQQGNVGYLVDVNNQVVRTNVGLCVHTAEWTPALAVEGCDPVAKKEPVSAKVTLQGETLFTFDTATLTLAGKQVLNKIVAQAKVLNLELVTAVGYTDRIGSDAYNKKLSQRRAQAVQEYLVTQGIPTPNVYAEGKGKANPVTGNACPGNKVTKQLIACLQPDRRVVIEIIGTK